MTVCPPALFLVGLVDAGYVHTMCLVGLMVARGRICALILLAGCAYDPPVSGDHGTEKYRADLAQCRQTVDTKIDLLNRSTFPAFVMSPFTGPPRKHDALRDCMVGKGYNLSQQ